MIEIRTVPDALAETIGTAEALQLDLTFERTLGGADPPSEGKGWRPGDPSSLTECLSLIQSVTQWIGTSEVVSQMDLREEDVLNATLDLDASSLRASEIAPSGAQVRLLHYGSPFVVELVLNALTIPGFAVLLYGAKRLYGLPLEFQAYREQRRVEYLEAKKLAAALEASSPTELTDQVGTPQTHVPDPWALTSGVIRDESE